MNKKRFMMAILLISVVCIGTSAVFAEDANAIEDNNILAVENSDVTIYSSYTISPGATSDDIQNTLNGMNDGDVLNFESGTYSDICIYVNKSITINGNGATLIGYDTPSMDNTPSIITNKTAEGGYGITNLATLYVVKADNVAINGLNIVGGANSASTYSNALVFVADSNNLTFINNGLDGSSWGLYLQYSSDGIITDNLIQNQAVTGILNFGSARTQIERNKVVNAKNHGIDVRHGTGPNVQAINNTIIGSQEGIYLMHSQGHTAAYNTIINCSISSISCYGSSNINLYNNTLTKSRIGILLGGGYSNINVGTNTFNLNNLPYPPTFVYYIAEAQSDYQSATNIMGTHSDSSSYTPTYTEFTEIPAPKNIEIDYNTILSETGTTYVVPEGTSSANIQKMIDSMKDGDTLKFTKDAIYTDISIYVDKNVKIIGNGATLVGYDNTNLTNVPSKITATTADGGYGLENPAVLYSVNNTGVVISDLNIISKYPGYEPLSTVPATSLAYKTCGIRTSDSKNITITGCTVDGASWGIYLEYSGNAIVTNNKISNQFTTGILNFGTPDSIIAGNTITNVANHGIDVRHGTGPRVTITNNTISGAREGIYLMHSQGHQAYGNVITDVSISGITAYGSGNEYIYANNISGSRIGIILGGGYYNVTIRENTYDLDFLPFPPTFVTYLAKAESKYGSAAAAVGTYSNPFDTIFNVNDVKTTSHDVEFELKLTTAAGKAVANQTVSVTINNVTYDVVTDATGVAKVNTTLDYGEYAVSMAYAGEGNYVKTIGSSSILVAENGVTTTITAKDITVDYKSGSFEITLTDSNNQPAANQAIAVTINNQTTTVTTNKKGVATLALSLETGTYPVDIVYAGDDDYYGPSSASAIITVRDKFTSVISIISVDGYGNLIGTLKDSTGKAITNAKITYKHMFGNGTVTTDSEGKFNILGAYDTVSMSYAGNDYATATSAEITLNNISHQKQGALIIGHDLTIYAGDTGKLKVELVDIEANPLAGKDVWITIDGVTKIAKTNAAGIATLDVSYATATTKYVTLTFMDDPDYDADMDFAKIIVNKKATTLTASKATLKAKQAKKVTVTLKSGGKAVAGKKVTITVNGKTFSGKTNANGKATISVKVNKAGTFVATVKFAGDGAYKASTKKVKYTVKK